jgi:predicted ATPase/class 3 adenylate cyclase
VDLPVGGAVTFLFSDIEGSTRLARALGDEAWPLVLREHDALIDAAVVAAHGVVVQHEGDGAFAAFANPDDAVSAALAIQRAIAARWGTSEPTTAVRIGLHTGVGQVAGDGYVGIDVHYAARVSAAGNGRQIVLSEATANALTGALPADAALIDDGFHRLKDFDEPRHLFRLTVPGVADDERPLRTLRRPTNLPEPVTTFVGRERELTDVVDLVARGRIVTLTGPGGTGKTRLAIGVAGALQGRFVDGAWFVDLAPVRDPDLMPNAVASALGLREVPETPLLDSLRAHLRDRSMVLVLDNLEQLLPTAAGLVAELVRHASGVHVLVTSREVLRIGGEQEYPVPPLADRDAIDLFVDRARLVRPDFAIGPGNRADVEALAMHLEGLPLAVELAAARIRLFPPAVILERLERALDLLGDGARDLPERQRTIRGAIAWSVDLLTDDERTVFRRLSVFSGGWVAEATEPVASPDAAIDAVAVLESLADKSLIRIVPTEHGEPRFTRHAFIREYAAELLEAAGERAATERRHAQLYVRFAEEAEPHLMAEDSDRWLDLIDHERHNLRAAMRWSLTVGEPEAGLRIAAAIWRFWHQRTELREGRWWLEGLLAHPAGQADSPVRLRAISAAGGLAYWSEDFPAAWRAYEMCLAMAERLGDERLIADAHYELGFRYVVEANQALVRVHEGEALRRYEALGDDDAAAWARQALALSAIQTGDAATARTLEDANLAAFRRSGSWYRTAESLTLLAVIDLLDGDIDLADAHNREGIEIIGPRAAAPLVVGALGVAANIAIARGQLEHGARLGGASAGLALHFEIANANIEVLHMSDPVVAVREQLGEAAEPLLAEGGALTLEDALELASR